MNHSVLPRQKIEGAATPRRLARMSTAEILDELPKLTPLELQHIRERILELGEAQEVEETPELLAVVG